MQRTLVSVVDIIHRVDGIFSASFNGSYRIGFAGVSVHEILSLLCNVVINVLLDTNLGCHESEPFIQWHYN
jgi:hypothetical protein